MSTKTKPKAPSKFVTPSQRLKLKESKKGGITKKHVFEPLDLSLFPEIEFKEPSSESNSTYQPQKAEFILEKVYLQRPSIDPKKLLVYLYVDYGFLKPNRLKKFVMKQENKYKILVNCKIIVLNDAHEIIAEIPMLHSSKFKDHPIIEAPELFVGLINGLKEEKQYYYTIECWNKDTNKLIARTNIFPIRIASVNETKPLFLVAFSDVHGGHSAWFKRGKVWCLFPRKNKKLSNLMQKIVLNEDDFTFNKGYSLACASGDIVDNGSYHEYWADLFECCAPLFSQTAFISAIGNHDYYTGGFWRGSWLGGKIRTCKYYHAFLQTPRETGVEGHYFSLDVGNAHLIFLDSIGPYWGSMEFSCDSEEWKWLHNELKEWRRKIHTNEGRKFSLVFLHSAIFSAGFFGRIENNSDYYAQCHLTPLMRKYGGNIAFFGHDHIYQRSIWKDTNYICLGLSAGVATGYNKKHIKRAKYKVPKVGKGKKVRGYAVIYIPPNTEKMSKQDKKEFETWIESVEEILMKNPLTKYCLIDKKEAEELEKEPNRKREYIKTNITSKLINHLWYRYYTIKDVLYDADFFPVNTENYNEEGKIDYQLKCPEEHL